MKMKSIISITIIALLMPLILPAQTKFEREYRIKEKEVPENASQFVRDTFLDKKIKWYAEESQDGNSIEAKVKFRKHKYSVEFDTLGNLQDVEKTIKFKDLTQDINEEISRSLAAKFGDYKIMKIQIQWTAEDPATLKELINKGTTNGTFIEKYEIVVETREEKKYKAYELLMGQDATIEKSLEVDMRSMNNMEF